MVNFTDKDIFWFKINTLRREDFPTFQEYYNALPEHKDEYETPESIAEFNKLMDSPEVQAASNEAIARFRSPEAKAEREARAKQPRDLVAEIRELRRRNLIKSNAA